MSSTCPSRAHLAAEATELSDTLRTLLHVHPRRAGSIVFHGVRRDIVYAFAGVWAASSQLHSSPKTMLVPGTSSLFAKSSLDRIEIDLDAASQPDTRAFFSWIAQTVRSRHCMYGSHVIVVHAAERAGRANLSKLIAAPFAVLVASTTRPDAEAIRSLSGVMHVRVPCRDPLKVPAIARNLLKSLLGHSSVLKIRSAIHTLRCNGFTLDEIARFSRLFFAPNMLVDEKYVKLAHIASASMSDARATETLVAYTIHGLYGHALRGAGAEAEYPDAFGTHSIGTEKRDMDATSGKKIADVASTNAMVGAANMDVSR